MKKASQAIGLLRGFTLNEVIICIAVVSIAFLGTISALTAAQRSTAYGQRMSLATGYCRQICEIIRARGLAASATGPPVHGSLLQTHPPERKDIPINDGAPFADVGAGDAQRARFTRSIVTERISNTGFGRNLYKVTVKVWWREGERWCDVEMTTLSRVPLT